MRIILGYASFLIIVIIFLAATVNFQSPPSVYEADLLTRMAAVETKVGEIVPTQEFFYTPTATRTPTRTVTPTPTLTPTPITDYCIGTAAVDTGDKKLNVRDAPNGKVIGQMNNGAAVLFFGETRKFLGSYTWVKLVGKEAWVALEFLLVYKQPTCW